MNMESTRNVTPSSSVVNIADSYKNVNNLPQQCIDLSQPQVALADFKPYNSLPMNNTSILEQYKKYNSVFQSNYMCQNSTLATWQNGAIAPNGIQNLSTSDWKIDNYNSENDRGKFNPNSYMNPDVASNKPVTLNIPKYLVKNNLQSTTEVKMETVSKNLNETPQCNVNPRVYIDSMKRKSLEKTVRLIENILMNTTRKKKLLQEQQESDDSVPNSVDTVPKDISESEDSDYNKDNNNFFREEISNKVNSNADETDNATSEPTAQINIAVASTPMVETPTIPLIHSVVIKTEPLDADETEIEQSNIGIDSNIVVKVEELSTWEGLMDNPFLRDANGVKEVGPSAIVIDGFNSLSKATEGICNGPSQSTYYECQFCSLLIQHPKRFLIHTKWHTFGLAGIKREEIKKEKELTRQKKKEELVRLKEEEATDPLTGQRMHRCTACDKKFPTKNSMKYHRKRFHPKVYEKLRECKICNKQFPDWQSMQAHKKTHLPASEYTCDECPKKFKYPHSLAKHKQTHLEKTHQCPECPKAFGSTYLLKTHAKTHERIAQGQTHRCSYCGKGYYNAYTLQVHERTHRNEKPYVCNICNTSYGTNSSLTRHLKVSHGGAKPFECDTCHRCFISERIRDRHAARAHGDPALLSHACRLCECRYLSAKYLRKHIEKVHPKEREKMKRAKRGSVSD